MRKCALRDSLSRSSFAFSSGGCPKRPPLAFRGASPSARMSTPEQRKKSKGRSEATLAFFEREGTGQARRMAAKKGRGKGAMPLPLPFVVKSRER